MINIINELRLFDRKFPLEAIKNCIDRKEEATEFFLNELDELIRFPDLMVDDEEYMLHIYAVFILAQFKEKRAFNKIVTLFLLSSEELEIAFGDVVTESLSSILYSTFDGNLEFLKNTIESDFIDHFVRAALIDLYTKLYLDGLVSKDDFILYLRSLLYDDRFYSDDVFYDIATDIQCAVVDTHLFEMIDDIEFMYDENRIDDSMFGEYDSFIDEIYSYKYEWDSVKYIVDTIDEMKSWPCFEQSKAKKENTKEKMNEIEKIIAAAATERHGKDSIKKPKKIGRNDNCPCGSGKKYKKCCLNNDPANILNPKNNYLESYEEQIKWLEDYPITSSRGKEEEKIISDIYDIESIEIDKLVYLALHYRPIPIWQVQDDFKVTMNRIAYLSKAYEKFILKCEHEGIKSFSKYDSKYKIHYRSHDWIGKLKNLINTRVYKNEYKGLIKEINKTLKLFSRVE